MCRYLDRSLSIPTTTADGGSEFFHCITDNLYHSSVFDKYDLNIGATPFLHQKRNKFKVVE